MRVIALVLYKVKKTLLYDCRHGLIPRTHLLGRQDVRVTSIGDGEDTGAEELTASSTKVNVVYYHTR